jgi:hypothetical protein
VDFGLIDRVLVAKKHLYHFLVLVKKVYKFFDAKRLFQFE